MTGVVYKYEFPLESKFSLQLPQSAEPMQADVQGDKYVLWCFVDKDETRIETRDFLILGTGHPIDREYNDLYYVNTFYSHRKLVWHLFEVLKSEDDEEVDEQYVEEAEGDEDEDDEYSEEEEDDDRGFS